MTVHCAAFVFNLKKYYLAASASLFVALAMGGACDAFQAGQIQTRTIRPDRGPVHQESGSQSSEFQGVFQESRLEAASHPNVEKLTLTGRFHLIEGTRSGVLILKAQIPEGSYIYSVTQAGNPPPSKIIVSKSKQFRISGPFNADRNPKIIESDPVFENRLEKHSILVQFFVPIEIAPGIEPAQITPEIVFDGQICSEEGTCMPVREWKTKAVFAGYYEQQAQTRPDPQNRQH